MSRKLPYIIRNALLLNASMLIGLSVFVGVKNTSLDLVFTLSVSLLVFVIHLIVDDLYNFMSPEAWQATSAQYASLKEMIEQ